jgi:hypothetical protein
MKLKYNFILMLLDQRLCFNIEVNVIGVGYGKMCVHHGTKVHFLPREIVALGYTIGRQQSPSGRKSYTLVP